MMLTRLTTSYRLARAGSVTARSLATVASSSDTVHIELKSGPVFKGKSFGARRPIAGELVFTTGMVGYPEAMSDPSYRGQIIVFTQPLVGNYGVPPSTTDKWGLYEFLESSGIQTSGIIVSNYAEKYSHWNAVESLGEWCKRFNVPAVTGVDTRALTKLLRSQGSTLGRISFDGEPSVPFENPNDRNLVAEASTKTVQVFNPSGDVTVVVVDCGVKHNIMRCLTSRGAKVVLVPWDHDLSTLDYDGLLISNGPGDPAKCIKTTEQIKKAMMRDEPIFGICMGNLLMGMAAGASSYKLLFGNRGHNQPAMNMTNASCVVTSQNHGYAIKEETLPPAWRSLFVNVNDRSNEGIYHTTKPFFSVQFHPEFKGGPEDTGFLFDRFMTSVRASKQEREQQTEDVVSPIAISA